MLILFREIFLMNDWCQQQISFLFQLKFDFQLNQNILNFILIFYVKILRNFVHQNILVVIKFHG